MIPTVSRLFHTIVAVEAFSCRRLFSSVSYIQGQTPEANVREYFYYVDHHGMLFMDDSKMKNFTSAFKEKQFLEFFFKRVRVNTTGRYEDTFPFISLCGRERNFIRCDDRPIVFTHLVNAGNESNPKWRLTYGHASPENLHVPFEPQHLCMFPTTGRVYHPCDAKAGGVGLLRSALAIQLSSYFGWPTGVSPARPDQRPTTFTWQNETHNLSDLVIQTLRDEPERLKGLFLKHINSNQKVSEPPPGTPNTQSARPAAPLPPPRPQTTSLFRALNFELFWKPNRKVMAFGVISLSLCVAYLSYMKVQMDNEQVKAEIDGYGGQQYHKRSKWD